MLLLQIRSTVVRHCRIFLGPDAELAEAIIREALQVPFDPRKHVALAGIDAGAHWHHHVSARLRAFDQMVNIGP